MDKNDLVKFRSECLSAHNFYRSLHATTPLIWSNKLADGAQRWAEELASADSLSYSHERGVGENIACLWGSDVTGNKITQIWYEEAQHFDYTAPRVTPITRPFCQVIWEGTRELGAGKSTTKNGKHIVVARYNPPASRRNAEKNVKRPRLDRVDGDSSLLLGQSLGLRKFQEECLFAHNEFRVLHGSPPLHWSPSLAWAAQQWAEELVRMGELKHNDDEMIGENLAGMVGDELTGKECTDMWYDEAADYDYNNPGYSEDTSNFTQVVWIGSELFGVGRATLGDLCVVVAFYEPPGNMEGLFAENVRQPGSKVKTYRLIKETKTFIPPSPDLDWFRLECLVAHNYFRARHAATPLVLTHTLNEEAQYWAERLMVTGATEDLQDSRIGINVAVIEGQQHVSGLKVTELWYQESTSYDFESPGFNLTTRSFTQLLWLTSRKLGVGKASNDAGQYIIVARYEPVGNIDGLFVSNVRRRGHERNALEPMLFESDVKYRIKVEGRRSLRMSWEVEGAMIQADNKHHDNARRKERAQPAYMSSPENFTRLVWIESPVLPRRRMRPGSSDLERDDKSDEDKESGVEEGDEFDNEEPLFTVVHSTEEENIEPCFEHAFVYTDPIHTAYSPDVRRSLSLDSQGTEPEPEEGRVLSRVSYFEQLEKIEGSPKRDSREIKKEVKKTDEHEETVCQLEFDDVFPKHDENDERDHDFASDEEADDDDDDGMSLETVSEADEDLMADLDEFEMDHHIKSYCYEDNFVREQDDINTDKAEEKDHEQMETHEESASSPDHCVAVSVKRESAVDEELKRVDHIFEFVPRGNEKLQKEIDLNKIDLSETKDEQELFKFEAQSEKVQKHSGPPCTEVVEESNRNKFEQSLDLEDVFSSSKESDKPKAKPPPTLPKPQRPKQQTRTETLEKNKVIVTEQITEIVPCVKEEHSTVAVIERKEICEEVAAGEVKNETVLRHIEEEYTILEQKEVQKDIVVNEQDEHSVTEETKTIREERHLKDSAERTVPREEQDEGTEEEEKDSTVEEPKEIYEETEIRDVDDGEVFSDEEALEVIDVSHIDRDRKVHKILNRLGRQFDLIPLEVPEKKEKISKDIDLSETDEEKVLFDLYTPSSIERTWSSCTADEEIITPLEKQIVECALDFDKIFKDEEEEQENEPKEPTPREKRRSVSFKETVIIQDYESVREEPLQQEDDQYEYCEEESEEDVETFDEYDDEIRTKSDNVQEISFGQPLFLSHEVQEATEIVCDDHDAQEENFEEEDTSAFKPNVEESPHPIHLSEELSRSNEYNTFDFNDQEPIGSVAEVYEEYEKSYASQVDEGTFVTPVHVAAEVQLRYPVETVPIEEESIRSSTYDSFIEVQPEAYSSRVVVPSSCHVTAEMEVHHSEVQPVEEAEVDTLLSDEESEETIESASVRGFPESTESTFCITMETTYHQKTAVINKRAPSIEVDTYNENEQIPTEENSCKEILSNGHCASTCISHDTEEKTHEAIVESESHSKETPKQLEDSEDEVKAVPCDDVAQCPEEEKELEEGEEPLSEDEIVESFSCEGHVQHFEERIEEVLEDTIQHGREEIPAISLMSQIKPSPINEKVISLEEEEESVEKQPETVEYENALADASDKKEEIPVAASSPPKSRSPVLDTYENIEHKKEEIAEEEPEIFGRRQPVEEDVQSEEECIPVQVSSPKSPSPILVTDENIEPEKEEIAAEEPDYGQSDEEDVKSEDEEVPVLNSSPAKSPSSVLVTYEYIEPKKEESAEEEPEVVGFGHDEENVQNEDDDKVPLQASSPPKSPSPFLITDESIEPEKEEPAEEEPELVDYIQAGEEDVHSEDKHVSAVASSTDLITRVVEDEEMETVLRGDTIKDKFPKDIVEEEKVVSEEMVEEAEKPVKPAPFEAEQVEEHEQIGIGQDNAHAVPKTTYEREEEAIELEDDGHVLKVVTREETSTVQEGNDGNEDGLAVKKTITRRIVTATTTSSSQFISEEPLSVTEFEQVQDAPEEVHKTENQERELPSEVLEEQPKEKERGADDTLEQRTEDETLAEEEEQRQAESVEDFADEILESQPENSQDEFEVNQQERVEDEPENATTIERETIELEDGGHFSKCVTREEFVTVAEDEGSDDDDSVVSKTITRRIVTTSTTASKTQYASCEPLSLTKDELVVGGETVKIVETQEQEHRPTTEVKEELEEDRGDILETSKEEVDDGEEKHTSEHMFVNIQQASEVESVTEQTELEVQEVEQFASEEERIKEHLDQPKPSDDRFGYISEEELEETEELYVALRKSFEEQEVEENVDVDNDCIEESSAVVDEKFEPSEDDIAYDSEVITEVEKEITSALVVKESFSSAVYDDEQVQASSKEIEAEPDEKINESLVQFDECDKVSENPDLQVELENSPSVMEESEDIESSDEIDKVQLIEFTEDTGKEQEGDDFEQEEDFEEFDEEVFGEDDEEEVFEEDDVEEEELESSGEMMDENVELIQFSERDDEKIENVNEEPCEKLPSPVHSSPDDEEKDLDSLEENAEKSLELIQFSEQDEVAEVETSIQYANMDEVEDEEEKEAESSEELVEESVELIQFSETSEEEKIVEFDENSKEEVQYVEESKFSKEEKTVQLVQFSELQQEEKTAVIEEVYDVEHTEHVQLSPPHGVMECSKSEDETPKEETSIDFSDDQAQVEEEITLEERRVAPCIPILLTECEKPEQEEEVELYILKDEKDGDFINISGEPLACSTPIYATYDRSFDDSGENVFGENYEAIQKIIAHNQSDELKHSFEVSHDDSYYHIEAEEVATRAIAETEELDDSLPSPRKEVVEDTFTETKQSKVESIDLSSLEDQDQNVSNSHEDHVSPPPTIIATEFVADEEEKGSDEEYIPHFDQPRTYMVENKELLIDSSTSDAVDSSLKTDFTNDTEDPSEVSATSDLSEAIEQEPDVMSFYSSDLHSEPKDEFEEEDQERIQRKHETMEKVFLRDEMDIERSEPESRQESEVTETRHEESKTVVNYTTATVSIVSVVSDKQEEHAREGVATMIMEADEQKLEDKEPKPEHFEEHEAMTEDDFRSDGTPSKSDESFDDLEKTLDQDDTLSGVYQEEVEVSKLEPAIEEQHTETQESAPIDVDVAFTEEVEIGRVPVVEEAPEPEPLEEISDEEKQAEDVFQEEVEIQRVDDYGNNDVFEEEVEVRRVEEQYKEQTLEVNKETVEETVAVYEEELEVKAEAETPEDDSAGVLLAEPISTDAERDEEHTSEEEILQAELVREPQGSDSPESDQQQELEEYEIEELDHAIPHEMQGTDEQEHLYDNNNNQSMTRYYVDFSPAGSFERDSTASEGEYPEVYRQGEPIEEDMEEFILVKYGDQHEHSDSSGEEDLSEHREMYVIPEEDSEDRAQHTDDDEKCDNFEEQKQEPDETVFYEQGFMNPALEDINEDEEEGDDNNKDKESPKEYYDDEEKRQLEEYERLESFVMLEEKLSQVESGESLEDLTSDTVNKRASSDETLNDDDELADTMNTSSTLKESTSKEGSGDESNNELEKTVTTEEEEVVDLEDGGVLTKRIVRGESYSFEEDAGGEVDDDNDRGRTLTRKRVARKVITTTTTSETHVTKTPKEDQQSILDDEKDGTVKDNIVIEDIPSDEDSPQESNPENTSTLETEQETINLGVGGTVSKVATREETCTFDNDEDDGDDSSVVQKTMTRRIVTTTTTRASRTTQLSDQPQYLTERDENANRIDESSSSETHETVIKSRQHGEEQATIDHPAKRQLSREASGSFPDLCAEPLRKRLAKRFDSRDSLEGHSSEFSADSTGESTSKSSEDQISDDDYPGLDEFQRDCIRQHNIYRHQHRACRLVWSEDLVKDAAAWADHLASTNTLEHSSDKDHGENLASAKGYEIRGDKVAEMWYTEIEDYNFETPAFNAKCGHFTQMIWKDTKEIGVAKSVASDGTQYVVARYYPPGNVVGEFKNCIRRARGQRSSVRKRRRSSARRRINQTDGVDPVTQQEKFKNECVVSHNYYRSLHGIQPLQWSTRLAIESQNFAEKLARSGSFMRSGDKDVGECLAFSFGLELSGRDAVDSWYDEIVDYDYEFPGFTSHTANFTQIVWQESREFGMGKAISEDGSCVVVGRYYPPGNQVGCFQDNVKPKQGGYF